MLKKTNELYEGLTEDVFLVKTGRVAIMGELSEDIKEGIDAALEVLSLSEEEEKILELKYNCNMFPKEIAQITGTSHQKIRSQLENIYTRIRASSKYVHFFRGLTEGEAALLYAKGLIRKQLEKAGYDDYSKEILALDTRYLTLLGAKEEDLYLLYKAGYHQIGEIFMLINITGSLNLKGLKAAEVITENIKKLNCRRESLS